MKYIELFAGIGGMGWGLMQAGMECVGYVEWDKFAHKAFQLLHDPEERMWNAYDVRDVTDDDIRLFGDTRGPIGLIAGGFPCQAFSIAGKRKGFQDRTRGTLFFEIVRFASILRPKYLLLENVTGLLNHDQGRTFETVIRTLDELGYVGEWCVLNSAAYVPQNRERVFIVASLRGAGGRKVFPFGGENANAVEVVGRVDINADDYCKRVYSTEGLAPCLPTMQGGSQEPKILQRCFQGQYSVYEGHTGALQASMVDKVPMVIQEGSAVLRTDGMATCLDANYAKGLDNHGARTGIIQQGRGFNKGGFHSVSPTLTKNSWEQNNHLYDGYRIRKLTPLECFRLQSFPDWWYYKLKEHGISDSQLYKMAGNAVTSVVAYEIAKRLVLAEWHQSNE